VKDLHNPVDTRAIRIKTALHIQDMYLPLVREFGLWEIQQEMQEQLLHIIDPDSEKEIQRQCKAMASAHKIKESEKKISEAVEDAINDYIEKCENETKAAMRVVAKVHNEEQKLLMAFDKSARESGISSNVSSFKKTIKEVVARSDERVSVAQAKVGKLRDRERRVKTALKPNGKGKPSKAEIKSRRKTDYSIWAKIRDMLVCNAEKDIEKTGDKQNTAGEPKRNGDQIPFVEDKVPYTKLGGFINIASLYDVNGHQVLLPDILMVNKDGTSSIDHEENCALIAHINEHISKLFEPVPGRIKDYIAKPKPTYMAFHNTYYIDKNDKQEVVNSVADGIEGVNSPAKKKTNEDEAFTRAQVEVQIFTDSMKKLNESTHAYHKERPTKETGRHPSKQGPKEVKERSRYYADTVRRINARISKENLPYHEDRTRIIICDRNGDLMSVMRGTTLGDLIQMAYANEGGVCDKDGCIVPPDVADVYINLLSSQLYQGEKSQFEKELPHAAYIDFLCFSPPKMQVSTPVLKVQGSLNETKDFGYDNG
jgi:hypothetical protein